MQAQISSLLTQTFSGTNDVSAIEEELNSILLEPEFFPSLKLIILTNSNPSLQKSGISYLGSITTKLWPDLPQEIKAVYLELIIELSLQLPLTLQSNIKHLIKNIIIRVFLSGEWENLPDVFMQLAESGEINIQRTTLTLACSLSKSAKDVNPEFLTKVLEYIIFILENASDFYLLKLCFESLNRMIISSFSEPIFDILPHLFEILASKNIFETADEKLINSALKFFISLSKINKSISLVELYPLIINLLGKQLSQQQMCLFLQCLTPIVSSEEGFTLFNENYPQFIQSIAIPIFTLTPDNVQLVETNPPQFIQEVHKLGDYDTTQLSVHSFIKTISQKLPATMEIPFSIISETLSQATDSSQIFGLLHLMTSFSSILMETNPEEMSAFIFNIAETFFECDDEIARCAAFMLISYTPQFIAPLEMISAMVTHIEDPSRLVQYYCAVAISNSLKSNREDASREDLSAALQYPPEEIFHFFILLSSEFSHPDLITSIFQLIEFQGASISSYAGQIATDMLTLISQSDDPSVNLLIFNSLQETLEILAKTNEAKTVLPQIFETSLQIAASIAENEQERISNGEMPSDSSYDTISSLFEVLSIIPLKPTLFIDELWSYSEQILQFFGIENDEIKEKTAFLLGAMIFKDNSFTQREFSQDLIKTILEMINSENFLLFSSLLSAICFRVPEFIEEIIPQLLELIDEIDESSHLLLDIILIKAPSVLLQASGEFLPSLIQCFLDGFSFPNSVPAALSLQSVLSEVPELRIQVINTMIQNSQKFDDEDDDFDDFNETKYEIINQQQAMSQIWQFILKLQTEDIFQAVLEGNEQIIELYRAKYSNGQ